jgi:hypothetical protein
VSYDYYCFFLAHWHTAIQVFYARLLPLALDLGEIVIAEFRRVQPVTHIAKAPTLAISTPTNEKESDHDKQYSFKRIRVLASKE